jgi:sugar-specific transcriptional regulator TrmB
MPRRLEKLKEFGLSDYASRAYLALLQLGEGDARQVSNASRVPAAKIHATLRQLEQKGLVDVLPGTPKRYHPRKFSEFLRRAAKEHADRAEELHAESKSADDIFAIARAIAPDDRGKVRFVKGRRNSVEQWRELVDRAERDILIVGADQMATRVDRLLPILRDARERDVRVRILANRPADASIVEALAAVAELRDKSGLRTEASNVGLSIFDDHTAFLSHVIPDDGHPTRGQDVSLCTDVSGWVRFLRDLVEHHWQSAPPLLRS